GHAGDFPPVDGLVPQAVESGDGRLAAPRPAAAAGFILLAGCWSGQRMSALMGGTMGAKVSPVRLSPARISPVVLAVAALVAMPGAARGVGLMSLSLDELVDSASLEDLGNLVVTAQRREERAPA